MRTILTFLLLLPAAVIFSQKKVVPVAVSAITGIGLPNGSTKDNRLLTTLSGRLLLEMESKKDGTGIADVEVLYVPPVSKNNFGADSLVSTFSQLGWNMVPIDRDNKYLWLQKDGKSVLVYFEMQPKETQLYFGIAAIPPTLGAGTITPPPVNTTPPSDPNPPPVPPAPQNNSTPPPPPPSSVVDIAANSSPGNNGITISTTNFDDGWVATPRADWVEVIKGEYKVLLHYPIPLTDEIRNADGDGTLTYFWNLLIAPRFTSQLEEKRKFEAFEYPRLYFMEADVTDKSINQSMHVALRIYIDKGIASCVEVISPSKSSQYTLFTDFTKIDRMLGYNKFAVSLADLVGEWNEGSGSYAQYYNVYTGDYAGMNAVSINSRLVMTKEGQYNMEHKGATGMVGNQHFFSQKESGTYRTGNWEITTIETDGKETAYNAYYEAVKNGRILHMQNKQYTGMQLHLVKIK